ncbi:MAG: ATP-binding protein [bacterium]
MFGKILYMGANEAYVENKSTSDAAADMLNIHVIFENENQRILGEIFELDKTIIKIRLLGEFLDNRYLNGVLSKPYLSSKIRIINSTELSLLVGQDDGKSLVLGDHATYKGFKICPALDNLFANHLAIFGNSGSGKSYGTSRIFQNIFYNSKISSQGSNVFIFDSFGEYKTAFTKIGDYNKDYSYKFITTNHTDATDFDLKIPLNLMTVDDWTLLLSVETHSQITIIENTIKLARIFAQETKESLKYKNHLIAKALIAVMFSSQTTETKKNEIFKIIEVCSTLEFNFDTVIPGMGYTRTFSECFEVDSRGLFGESVLVTDYILGFIDDSVEDMQISKHVNFDLIEFKNALEFTLISGGFLHNETLYDVAIILKVRLNSIIRSNIAPVFTKESMTLPGYINSLIHTGEKKNQIININFEEVDDIIAKVLVKIISRMLFEYGKTTDDRAQVPFHIFLEEAHRYVQKDNDVFLIGYNIFERIAKEGRKYGVLLNIISQRPVEISDTVISQVSNFLIFKMTHPLDLKYIEEMLPGMSSDIIGKQKTLQPGTCVGFGTAFKIPMIIKLDLPDPAPFSSSCDIVNVWKNVFKIKEDQYTEARELEFKFEKKPDFNGVLHSSSEEEGRELEFKFNNANSTNTEENQ